MKDINWEVLAFYTRDSAYEGVYKEYLEPSLRKMDLPFSVVTIDNQHNWNKNVAEKPNILKQHLLSTDKNIVLLDVDAEILQYPTIFDELDDDLALSKEHTMKHPDIACHILSWDTWYNRPGCKITELLTGTMWIKNSKKNIKLCDMWYKLALESGKWEQQCLEQILNSHPEYNIYKLPLEYCYINTLPNNMPPHVVIENPVIKHHQKSRQFKKGV